MEQTTVKKAADKFIKYQLKHNSRKYAETVAVQIDEFVTSCVAQGASTLDNVNPAHIRRYLQEASGDWKNRYAMLREFFHYCIVLGWLPSPRNPMANTATARALWAGMQTATNRART